MVRLAIGAIGGPVHDRMRGRAWVMPLKPGVPRQQRAKDAACGARRVAIEHLVRLRGGSRHSWARGRQGADARELAERVAEQARGYSPVASTKSRTPRAERPRS